MSTLPSPPTTLPSCHYAFTGRAVEARETLEPVFEIVARRSILGVEPGAIGGWISSELLDDGSPRLGPSAWVADRAQISGQARLLDRATVMHQASVHGEAQIAGDAVVGDSAEVCGRAVIRQDSRIMGRTRILGDAVVEGAALIEGDVRVGDDAVIGGDLCLAGQFAVGRAALLQRASDLLVISGLLDRRGSSITLSAWKADHGLTIALWDGLHRSTPSVGSTGEADHLLDVRGADSTSSTQVLNLLHQAIDLVESWGSTSSTARPGSA